MPDAYLDDDGGSEVAAVEAMPDGLDVQPQALTVRVGPVFYEGARAAEPGIWIEYHSRYRASRPEGPVLLTPAVWQRLIHAVADRLSRYGEGEDRGR